ncbi:MAG: membrane-bound O-acyltransferase family protein [Bacteroidetes bacterium HGW-Bacteroidetes-11]|nr:MAG: membrane-bound O-acyltransferase family protein [Bacteroidetes bacterium HGW-Bacteroidetes-11]
MLFSSPVFLFVFLPAVLFLYFLLGNKLRNFFLFLSSLVFFAWGGVSYSVLLIFSIIFNYFIGRGIDKYAGSKLSTKYLGIGVFLNLLFLGIFKYANFVVENLNGLLEVLSYKPFGDPGIILPIGISFYTFQAMSYLIDVYRKEAEVQKNPFNLGLYIALFPQLIAGPIVRYHDIAQQITKRTVDSAVFANGVRRFIIGLAKKVLLGNNMGIVADLAFNTPADQLSTPLAWLGLVTYALHIYFDFSGYSDMAIGLGKMFGFTFLENFNYPYVSRSIKEFWRRWHISLSTWFRDYLYVPLGGNRKGNWRTYFNLIIVFFVTGLWHGASWSFVLWGFLHGFFLIVERIGGSRFSGMFWRPVQHLYTIFVVLMAWVLFRADSLGAALSYYGALFGNGAMQNDFAVYNKILNFEFLLFFTISLLSATGIFIQIGGFVETKLSGINERYFAITEIYRTFQAIFLIGIFVLCSVYLITNTYNPFIYYRF